MLPTTIIACRMFVVFVLLAGCTSAAPEPATRSAPTTLRVENTAGGEVLRDQPHRDDVRAALSGIQTQVAACGGGQHGLAMTSIKVLGATGHVSGAEVYSGDFVGTPVGECITRAARAARFPRFRNESFTVSFPFRI